MSKHHTWRYRLASLHVRKSDEGRDQRRMGRRILSGCLLGLILQAPTAGAVSITVQTTSCNGDQGVASFESTRLFKIQAASCQDPTNPEQKLQQILIRSGSDLSRYDVLTVSNAESALVMERMRNIGDAELDRISRPDVIIENRSSGQAPSTRPSTTSPDLTLRSAPPIIQLADPAILPSPRSSTSVITAPDTKNRTVVGTARADAGLFSVTVNGQAQTFDDKGLFSAAVPIQQARTPVSIVAVDNQGQRATVDFQFVREPPQSENPEAGDDVFGRYHALIIANSDYQHMDKLATPLNDATAIAALLKNQYGFEVKTIVDADRYQLVSALNDQRRDRTDEDNLLIYFAGHGAYDTTNHRGHWLPVDAEPDSTANWVSTVAVTDIVNAMSARHVLVVADSCYSGSLARSASTELDPGMSEDLRTRWLRAIAQTRSRHVLTSGGVKPVVDDGGTGHSIFANALIQVLEQGSDVIESSVLSRRVKQLVQTHAESLMLDQTPQYAQLKHTGHEFGEFLLVRQ